MYDFNAAAPSVETLIAEGRLVIECPEHLDAVRAFARSVDAEAELDAALTRWHRRPECRMTLHYDWAPHSFAFVLESKRPDGTWARDFNGGIIWSGPGNALDGSFPSLTVCLSPTGHKHQWTTHT